MRGLCGDARAGQRRHFVAATRRGRRDRFGVGRQCARCRSSPVLAEVLGVPVSTVRRWLRRFAARAEQIRVFFSVLAHDLDPLLPVVKQSGTAVADAVEAIGVAARAAVLRLGPVEAWLFASFASHGRLLSNTGWPLSGA